MTVTNHHSEMDDRNSSINVSKIAVVDEYGFFTDAASYVRFVLILVISSLIVISNLINLTILRNRKELSHGTRIFLTTLSTSDLCSGLFICMPCVVPALTGSWLYGVVWCQLCGVIYGGCTAVSICCVALVSVDRYCAVFYPLRYKTLLTSRRCTAIISALWIIALGTFMAPIVSKPDFIYYQFYVPYVMCGFYWEYKILCLVTGLAFPQLSGALIVFFTFRTVKALKQPRTVGGRHQPTDRTHGQNLCHPATSSHKPTSNDKSSKQSRDEKAMRIVIITALAYFILWGPYCVVSLTVVFHPRANEFMSPWAEFLTMWLGNCNCFMNVLIYSGVYPSFRMRVLSYARRIVCPCNNKVGDFNVEQGQVTDYSATTSVS